MRSLIVLLVSLVSSVPAAAQFTLSDPFVGTNWETFGDVFTSGVCLPQRVFADQADLCSADGMTIVKTPLGSGSLCTITAHGGERIFSSGQSPSLLTLDTYLTRFGAYFATVTGVGSATISFRDDGGALLHSDTVVLDQDCNWEWHGWDTGGAHVKTVEIAYDPPYTGAPLLDDMHAEIGGAETVGTPYCFCDGSGAQPPCNAGFDGAGCPNGGSPPGAQLSASGTASVSASSLVLHGNYLPTYGPGVFIQGDLSAAGGAGVPFGRGLLCVAQNVVRLETTIWPFATASESSVDIPAVPGTGILAGSTKAYQFWYRDVGGSCSCCPAFNLTNGLRITWVP